MSSSFHSVCPDHFPWFTATPKWHKAFFKLLFLSILDIYIIIDILIAVFLTCAAIHFAALMQESTVGLIKAYLISYLRRQLISFAELVVMKTMCHITTSGGSMTTG